MKIVLIADYLPDRSPSMRRYALMLERILLARGFAVKRVHPPAVLGSLPLLPGGVAKWFGYLDKYLIAPFYLRWQCRTADVVHVCDHSASMYLRCAGKAPGVLTCHDLLAIRGARGLYDGVRVKWTGRMQQRWIAREIRAAEHIICVSERTKQDVLELGPASGTEIRVIHNPLNRNFRQAGGAETARALAGLHLAAGTEYLFHVGGNKWYKNRLAVLRIFSELKALPGFAGMKLIMAGDAWTEEMRSFHAVMPHKGDVLEAGNVSDEDLDALYSGAAALLFPSREEGFGWPILEAQACGCPVITTNRAPMTEVAGDAAIFIDPAQPEAAARRIAEEWDRREALRVAGFRNLGRFDETHAVAAYCELYAALARVPDLTAAGGSAKPV